MVSDIIFKFCDIGGKAPNWYIYDVLKCCHWRKFMVNLMDFSEDSELYMQYCSNGNMVLCSMSDCVSCIDTSNYFNIYSMTVVSLY